MTKVQKFKTRHGKAIYYYRDRRTGFRRRLPDDPRAAEFYEAWKAADHDNRGVVPEARRGTWGELRLSYLRSPEYLDLAERTQDDYRRLLDRMKSLDPVPVNQMTPASMIRWRDKIAEGGRRRTANYCLAVMSRVFKMAILRGLIADNPLRDVPKLKRLKDAPTVNRPWTDGELAAMLDAASPSMRAAIALAAYTGLRQGDVLKFTWNARADGYVRQGKTGDVVFVPEHSALTAILDATPKIAAVVVATEAGRNYTGNGFRANFQRLKTRLEGEGKVGAGLTFHGLRHTVATKLADAGADDATIAAVTGHKSAAMVRRYTESRDKKKRAEAAIRLIDD